MELVEATGRYARLTLRLPGSGEELEMDLLKEALDPSFVTVQVSAMTSVRALSLEDTVGLHALARFGEDPQFLDSALVPHGCISRHLAAADNSHSHPGGRGRNENRTTADAGPVWLSFAQGVAVAQAAPPAGLVRDVVFEVALSETAM
jgi:hypothetical protein